jgi:hypothetical protein
MIGPERHAEMLSALLAETERLARREGVVEIELRLRIPANDAVPGFEFHEQVAQCLFRHGYKALRRSDQSYLVGTDCDDEHLLKSFNGNCRRRIRKAVKDGVQVSVADNPSYLSLFYESYLAMHERKGAPRLSQGAIRDGMEPLLRKGLALLLVGSIGNCVCNMVIVDTLGVPCGMLATRTLASVRGEVPSAGQLLQFEAMRRMRDRGKTYYDLGGCEGPVPVEGHPNYGVWSFKYEFNGHYVRFLPYFRKAMGSVSGALLSLAHRLRSDPL